MDDLYDKAYVEGLFAERDAHPEGSPESLGVSRRILDYTFSGHGDGKTAASAKYATMTDTERWARVEAITSSPDSEQHVEEFASLLCG